METIIRDAMGGMKRTKMGGLAFLAILAMAGAVACDDTQGDPNGEAAAAEQQQVTPQQQMDPDAAQQLMELQSIQQQLQPLQQQALEDEQLAAQLESIQTQVAMAMREENPEAVDRIEGLQEEMQAAQAAGDQQRMQALVTEAQGMQQEVQELQASVLEQPEIRQQVDEFEAAQRARMIEIDPEAEPLLDRMDEIIAELSS